MKNQRVPSLAVSLGLWFFLGGCGGIGSGSGNGPGPRTCSDGKCEVICTGGTYAVGTECVPFTACPLGSYVAKPGTATADTVCEMCPSGTFSQLENSRSCTPWSICPAGTYVANVPTSVLDRTCIACLPGTMTAGANQSSCTPAGQCPAGTVQTAAGTAAAAPVCAACAAGEYCPGRATRATGCLGDQWDDDLDPATICVAKTLCAPGNAVVDAGSAIADRECAPCAAGTFSSTRNAQTCATWSVCAPGTYAANVPSPVSDRQCIACPPGSYTAEADQSLCLTAADCPAGTVEAAPGTSSSPPVCTPCSTGEYCAGGGAPAKACADETWDHDANPRTECVAWTFCRPGSYVALPGSPTGDQACLPCWDGTFTDSPNLVSCEVWTTCAPGTFVGGVPSASNDRICTECGIREFSTQEDAVACTPRTECPAYTHFVAVSPAADADTQCSPCTDLGCAKYCDGPGSCIECLADADCENGALCVDAVCKAVVCGGDTVYFLETFMSGNAQLWWTNDGRTSPWEIGVATAGNPGDVRGGTYPDPATDHSSSDDNMLAGVVIGGSAPTVFTMEPHYFATSPFDISGVEGPVYLEYFHWLNSDSSIAMTNKVQVFDGTGWVTLWSGPGSTGVLAESSWQRAVHDVTAYKNPDFAVRFGYQVLSSSIERVSGWNIDDIRVASSPSCVPANP